MRRFSIVTGALIGFLTGVILVVVSYLGGQLAELPFFPFDLFEAVTRILPGPFIAASISTMVRVLNALQVSSLSRSAKQAEQLLALVQYMLLIVVAGVVGASLAKRAGRDRVLTLGLIIAAVLFALATLIDVSMGYPAAGPLLGMAWTAIVYGGWGLALGWLLRETLYIPAPGAASAMQYGRRGFLYLGGTALLALVAGAVGLGDAFGRSGFNQQTSAALEPAANGNTPGPQGTQAPLVSPITTGLAASPPQPTLVARIEPAPGTRSELTVNKDFYRIDIDLLPPHIDASTWKL
ncbi:MAG TPA: hypothetical protein VGK81_00720, partial [Anaerolineae bacterium]